MKYFLIFWFHESSDEPVWIAMEIDDFENVIRMIERFPDGNRTVKIVELSTQTSLIDIPFKEDEYIEGSAEVSHFWLTKNEFERHWNLCFDPKT